jgi:MraZ protein
MDRFLGRHLKRIDAKGRVSIPAPFRGVLQHDGFEGLFAVRSLDLAAVDCGGRRLMAEIDQLIGAYESFSADHQALSVALLGGSDTLTLDAEGRIFVPDWMRQAADLADEIAFVGQGNRFQIWAPAAFEVFEAEARHRAAALLRSRGAHMAPPVSPKGDAT